jgi:hypothetical protein
MPSIANMSVPKQVIAVLSWLASLPHERLQAFIDQIPADRQIDSREELAAQLRVVLPDITPSQANDIISLVVSLLSLHFSHGWGTEVIAERVTQDESLTADPDKLAALRDWLISVMSNPVIVSLAKAEDIRQEYQRVFHLVRIFSDLRPVFGEQPAEAPVGALITHMLKLDYYTAQGHDEIHIALDDDDLEELELAVSRARMKSKSLAEFLKSAGIANLSTRPD